MPARNGTGKIDVDARIECRQGIGGLGEEPKGSEGTVVPSRRLQRGRSRNRAALNHQSAFIMINRIVTHKT